MSSTTGQRPWHRELHVKDQLEANTFDDGVVRRNAALMNKILQAQTRYVPGGVNELSQMTDEFEALARSSDAAYDPEFTRRDAWNVLMNRFYDWADLNQIWVA